jgi:hypothetical protein
MGCLMFLLEFTKAKDKPWPHLKRNINKEVNKPSRICDGNGIVLKAHLSKIKQI